MTGASSIFAGDKLLTTSNPAFIDDMAMFELLGLKTRDALPTKSLDKSVLICRDSHQL